MKIQLDIKLNKSLRDKINEINNFSYDKTAKFQFPSDKRGSKHEGNAFNCICAALDRIDDLVKHCNTLDLSQTPEGTFALCDLFNYGQTLIDCITIIGDIYGVKYDSSNDVSSFYQKGSSGTGNDEKYFKYLRSICSVHPLETSAHKEYQGEQPEWCPYISFANSTADLFLSCNNESLSKADFIARVYRNDMQFSKHIPIKAAQIFHYIEKRYAFIKDIIQAIDLYNKSQIQEMKEKHILIPSECESYDAYLKHLEDEILIRCGTCEYEARTWRAIFKTHFKNGYCEKKLSEYKEELRLGIVNIHNGLQNMECLNDEWSFKAITERYSPELAKYHYQQEKMTYLFPSYAIEDRTNEDFSFINEPLKVDIPRMQAMLKMIEQAQENGAALNDLEDLSRYIDAKYLTTDYEWARIQLKIMEPVLGKNIAFDYFLNNWHLYLQVEIAKWLIGKK